MKSVVALTIVVTGVAGTALPALKSTNPTEVCGWLQESGLATRGWKDSYGTYACSSPYRTLGAGALPNNLAFYAEGDRATVREVKLVLNVNEQAQASQAHAELLTAASLLSTKAMTQPLPRSLATAIRSGKSASAKVGSAAVSVVREDWPTGKGYEIRVVIE